MKYIIESNHNIDEELLSQLYILHEKVYIKKSIGKPFQEWKKDFYCSYHNDIPKRTLLFSSNLNSTEIDGYIIITDPIFINNLYWSKILEGGVGSANNHRINFIKMFNYLFQYGDTRNINFFSETCPRFVNLIKILHGLEFHHMEDITEAIKLFGFFVGKSSFTFSSFDDHLVINRKTKACANYTGYILGRSASKQNDIDIFTSITNASYT